MDLSWSIKPPAYHWCSCIVHVIEVRFLYILDMKLLSEIHIHASSLSQIWAEYARAESKFTVEGPRNAAVINGTKHTMQCSTNYNDSTFRWWWAPTDPNGNQTIIYTGLRTATGFRSMYSFNVHNNISRVIIESVNTSYAGTYRCDIPGQSQLVGTKLDSTDNSAELVVLGMYQLLFIKYTWLCTNNIIANKDFG